MKRFNKKAIIITSVIAIILIAAGIIGFLVFQNHKKNEAMKQEIATYIEDFHAADREEKPELFLDFSNDKEKYNTTNVSDGVKKAYEEALSEMKDWFVSEYDSTLEDNTLADIETMEDKEMITASITNLEELIAIIELDGVLDENEMEEYEAKINDLVTSYNDRLTVIEVAEKKAEYDTTIADNTIADIESTNDKSKISTSVTNLTTLLETIKSDAICNEEDITAYETSINDLITTYNARISAIEEAEKKAAEEAKNKKTNGGTNNSGSTSSGSSSTTRDPSKFGGKSKDQLRHEWLENPETGEKIPGSDQYINEYTGDVYDEDGNYLYNIPEEQEKYS